MGNVIALLLLLLLLCCVGHAQPNDSWVVVALETVKTADVESYVIWSVDPAKQEATR